jgi:dihydrofolate reductase
MLVLLAAVAANDVIGRDGDLAWRNSEDLRHVKSMTMGNVLLMGRRTFDSIGRPLPGRRTVVLTRQPGWSHDGVVVAHTVEDAVLAADRVAANLGNETGGRAGVFVFGGAELYVQLIDRADAMEITEVHADVDGDVTFPRIDPDVWRETAREERDGFAWVSYRRR